MGERLFKRGMIDGASAYTATCSCGHTNGVKIGNTTGGLPPIAVKRKLEQRGWEIGRDSTKDVCPSCRRFAARVKPAPISPALPDTDPVIPAPEETPAMATDTVVPIRPDAPRTMGKSDRQVIWSKLTDAYPREDAGYAPGWSDERVSKDLGVPRAWVATLREENFGPAEPPVPAVDPRIAELDAQVVKLKNDLGNAEALNFTLDTALQAAYGKIERLGLAMKAVQELGTAGYDEAFPKPTSRKAS